VLEKNFKYGSSIISLWFIQTMSQIYKRLSVRMTDWENHRTQTEYEDSLITKNILFEFINNYFTLFLIAFLMEPLQESYRGHDPMYIAEVFPRAWAAVFGLHFPSDDTNDFEDDDLRVISGCPGASCLSTLQRQLLIVFTVKSAVSLIKQVVKPSIKRGLRLRSETSSVKELNKYRPPDRQIPTTMDNPIEKQALDEPYDWNFDDFKEMSLQFGYVTLFAVSYPLAALLAWFNNIIEMRLDAWQLCSVHQRARWRQQEDIGSWAGVFQALSLVNVITNACLIGFVGSQLAELMESSSDDATPAIGQTFKDRVKMWDMWAVVVVVEHAVLLAKFGVTAMVPSMPDWIGDARDALEQRHEEMTKDIDHSKSGLWQAPSAPSPSSQPVPTVSAEERAANQHFERWPATPSVPPAVAPRPGARPVAEAPPALPEPEPEPEPQLLSETTANPLAETPSRPVVHSANQFGPPAAPVLQTSRFPLARIQHAWQPRQQGQLEVREGDTVGVIELSTEDWALVRRDDGARGHVPTAYLQLPEAQGLLRTLSEQRRQTLQEQSTVQEQREAQREQQHAAEMAKLQAQRSARSARNWGTARARAPAAAAANAFQGAGASRSAHRQEVERVWRTIDTNGNGVLDWTEAQEMMRRLGKSPETIDLGEVMHAVDPDTMGEVRFEQFMRWWDSQGQQAQEQLRMLDEVHL